MKEFNDRKKLEKKIKELETELVSAKVTLELLKSSITYQLGYHCKRALTSPKGFFSFPLALYRLYKNHKYPKPEDSNININSLRSICDRNEDIEIILYANINPNVIDGSSIWYSSMITILSSYSPVLVILKEKPQENSIINNVIETHKITYIYPEELGVNIPFSMNQGVNLVREFDRRLPKVHSVVVRGRELSSLLSSTRQFKNRLCSYITDFYRIENGDIIIDDEVKKQIWLIYHQSKLMFCQTKSILNIFEEIVGDNSKLVNILPPIPDDIPLKRDDIKAENKNIIIGYAGKIAPNWGVYELLIWSKKLIEQGYKIKIKIAYNKISGDKQFVKEVNMLMKEPFVEKLGSLNRVQCIEKLLDVDYVWCYRPGDFENLTLEISTKLVEMIATKSKCLVFPSKTNIEVLGDDYPFFIKNSHDFFDIVRNGKKYDFGKRHNVVDNHKISNITTQLEKYFDVNSTETQKLLIAGHDLKFIDSYISKLKSCGQAIYVDLWSWGAPIYPKDPEHYYKKADRILCEWGLANAKWYSENNIDKKPVFIRMHAQEVRDKARKFSDHINYSNIENVIFVSEDIRKKAIDLWDEIESKAVTIPNFLLTDEFNLTINRQDKKRINIGMVGIVPQTKRLDRAIELVRKCIINDIEAHLYIKGHRPEELPFMHAPGRMKELEYFNELYDRIYHDGLGEYIHFDKWGNDVAIWYKDIDIILSPSDAESFHYALADGVLSGAYPIIWNRSGLHGVFPEDWIVNDTEEAFNRIKDIINNSFFSLEEKSNRRNYLVNKYDFSHIYKKLNKVIYRNK